MGDVVNLFGDKKISTEEAPQIKGSGKSLNEVFEDNGRMFPIFVRKIDDPLPADQVRKRFAIGSQVAYVRRTLGPDRKWWYVTAGEWKTRGDICQWEKISREDKELGSDDLWPEWV